MDKLDNPLFFIVIIMDHFVSKLNPLQNYIGIHSKLLVWITLLRVDSTIFAWISTPKWSDPSINPKEWISTPVNLGNILCLVWVGCLSVCAGDYKLYPRGSFHILKILLSKKNRVNFHSIFTPWVVTSVITSLGVNIESNGRDSTRWVVNFHSTGVRSEWNSLLNEWNLFTP